MALSSNEQFIIGTEAALRERVLMLSKIVAAEVAAEDPATLTGGLSEHNARFNLAQTALKAEGVNDGRVKSTSLAVAVALRDVLTYEGDALAVVGAITDDAILAVLRENWSFGAGFNIRQWAAEQAP